ncbi:SDR family NAD(P)-dependent oxidoreductase [Noviherbaspirillum sedimenti]|uniref:SDR family oxidoreductase n=1 Tax=Noviherbaspirillum sedimenti TaxID=2320865 RepID=A0A3A3FY69_9BURK|nr:SDR family oxidoreductase [Noviherbaspirillum sedimenti]RJG00674.1 SDR family oxidoreductase [Noviherbaspirillum sedimenti]
MVTTLSLELFSLAGKVAVVTGAGAGIGKGVARLFAKAGATLVIADRDLAAAELVAAELRAKDRAAIALCFDLADEASVTRLFDEVERSFHTVDILVNNAGIYPKFPLDSLTHAQWLEMQEVNVWGCFVCMREAARRMRTGGKGGRIINISSVGAARTAVHHQVAYNASKAALDSMTMSAALEYAPDGILVNSVLPGAVKPLDPRPKAYSHVSPTGPLMAPGRILLGRAADAAEVAGPILMLASAAGGYITGQTITIDGGFSIS